MRIAEINSTDFTNYSYLKRKKERSWKFIQNPSPEPNHSPNAYSLCQSRSETFLRISYETTERFLRYLLRGQKRMSGKNTSAQTKLEIIKERNVNKISDALVRGFWFFSSTCFSEFWRFKLKFKLLFLEDRHTWYVFWLALILLVS